MDEERKLLPMLEAHEAEVLEILNPLYAEVRHWEAELARTRKAMRVTAPDSNTRSGGTSDE